MKKKQSKDPEMRPEYDFHGGIRGKYASRYAGPTEPALADKSKTESISVWFDPEGDYLEVLFEEGMGYFRETADERVMVRVDMEDRIVGFNILGVSSFEKPVSLSLQTPPDEKSD